MPGILLDTHALYWLVRGDEPLREEALVAIGVNQAAGRLFVSAMTAWELAVAAKKSDAAGRPRMGDDRPEDWFRDAIAATTARVIPISQRIALEAAKVVSDIRHKEFSATVF